MQLGSIAASWRKARPVQFFASAVFYEPEVSATRSGWRRNEENAARAATMTFATITGAELISTP
jgi:hypothetical protein